MEEMTDKEVEEMTRAIKDIYTSPKEYNGNNMYQNIAIFLGVLGSIGCFLLGVFIQNIIVIIGGIFSCVISSIFLYGFGKIINDVERIRKAIEKLISNE